MGLKTTFVATSLGRSTVFLIVMTMLAAVATLPVSRTAVADDAQVLANCPTVGDATGARVRALNTLKRRMTAPTPGNVDPNVTLKAMVASGDDTNRWDEKRGATIEGYVADVLEVHLSPDEAKELGQPVIDVLRGRAFAARGAVARSNEE